MLKISTRTRYALRALLEMACNKERKLFSLWELARHQGISRKYLENIFAVLKKHRIVHSRVGKKGGFYLPAHINRISVLKILEALEGKVAIVHCLGPKQECGRIHFCPANNIWNEVNAGIRKTLAAKNLKDLSLQEEVRRKCGFVAARTLKGSPER